MNKLSLFALIVPREDGKTWQPFLSGMGLRTVFSFPCMGTATRSLMERLGLTSSEKTMFLAAAPRARIRGMMRKCINDMGLNVPGTGIAMSFPYESVGGRTALEVLLGGQEFDPQEVSDMIMPVLPYSMVVAICDNGHSETVMEAAREAGAGGGTVIHAKGTAGELSKRFVGVSLASEKDMVLVLVRQDDRRTVMQAIMDKAGIRSPAHTILFSLPVEEIAGLQSLMEEEA
ncbi:MAG: P-II family nitrogen regulator [Clostridia bacterium]|nr:P-II family nitrogen regulator [Clostridia bacterium]MBR4457763.1 P-II family nitrogen regulator [Clostridia bacterium]